MITYGRDVTPVASVLELGVRSEQLSLLVVKNRKSMKYLRLLLSLVFISVQFLLCAQNQTKDAKLDSKSALQKLSTIYY